jgi:hypothetical protein
MPDFNGKEDSTQNSRNTKVFEKNLSAVSRVFLSPEAESYFQHGHTLSRHVEFMRIDINSNTNNTVTVILK